MDTAPDIRRKSIDELHDPAIRREVFERLVEAYLRPLYWHSRRLVVVHEDAEDAVQEAFVRAYEKNRQLPGRRKRTFSLALPHRERHEVPFRNQLLRLLYSIQYNLPERIYTNGTGSQ